MSPRPLAHSFDLFLASTKFKINSHDLVPVLTDTLGGVWGFSFLTNL
jgi:hypothetical protein